MKYESAELTKISINILLASSITTANTLANICTHLGADWYEIMPALRLDKGLETMPILNLVLVFQVVILKEISIRLKRY